MFTPDVKLNKKLNRWSKLPAGIVLFVGIEILIEWQFNFSFLKQPIHGLVSTNPTTAFSFILLTVAFFLLTSANRSATKLVLGNVLLLIVFSIGVLKLLPDISGFDLHVDLILFRHKLLNESGVFLSNRMSFVTALNFILTCTSLFLLNYSRTKKWVLPALITLFVGLVGLLFILGYTYRVLEFHQVLTHIPMSLTSGTCFVFISTGILFAYPENGFMNRFTTGLAGSTSAKILIPVAIIVPIVLGYLRILGGWYHIFTVELGDTILITGIIVTFFAFIWYAAGLLNKKDALREQAENELRVLNEKLEQKVAERTASIVRINKDLADYKFALDASSIIAITDQRGIIQHVNDNLCKISKYSREELIGKDHRIVSSHYHSKEFIRNLWVTIGSGKIWKGELRNKAKDGTIYWVDTTIVPFLDEEGKPYKYLAIRSDISERKKAEEQLRVSEQRIRFVIENAPAGIAMYDRDMRYIMVSKRWLEDFRLGNRNIIGLSHYDLFPEIPEQWKEFHRRSLAGEKFSSDGEAFPRADGTVEWLKWELFPWYTETGTIGGVIIFSELVTERKVALEKLKASEENYRSIYENTIVAMFTNEMPSLKTIMVNDVGVRLYGYKSQEDFLTNFNPLNHVVNPADREDNVQTLRKVGKLESKAQEWKRLDGTHFWAKLFVNLNAARDRAQTVVIDITEQVQSREMLTAKIKELENANQELETFNFISSHDLQEPLRKIKNFTSLLNKEEKEKLSGEGRYYLNRMSETSGQMQLLIEDLLFYLRVKKAPRNFEKTDLNKIAQEVIAGLKNTINEKGALIKCNLLCEASVIPVQFQQLLHNLIDNSLKFSDKERKPQVIIKSETGHGDQLKNENLSPRTRYCHITVSDNGIGFDPKYRERIFGIFERLNPQDTFPGSGVGLAICKRIIENHKGFITASGELNKGAQFDIYLPLE